MQALMSRAVPANEQGLLQGALASLNSLTNIAGPPFWTALFGYSISPHAEVAVPGAAFFTASAVFLIALAIAWRWMLAPLPAAARAQGA
jgi:DHA1 family tetracycline resistance protein-like MFS transporter